MTDDVMRKEYRELDEEDKHFIRVVKGHGAEFVVVLDLLGQSREFSIAKTKIEEAVMWAVKGITK